MRNCSTSNGAELQSMPISSPMRFASSALKLARSVISFSSLV